MILTTTCPHCGAEPVPMTVHGFAPRDDYMVHAFVTCPTCLWPSAIVLRPGSNAKATSEWFFQRAQGNIDVLVRSGWDVVVIFPESKTKKAPEHTPGDIGRVYAQAAGAHQRRELDAAAILYRKVLEMTVKEIDADISGGLQSRIDALAKSDAIPSVVQQWAHEVRIVGNDAAHDPGEPDPHDVDEIAEFVEAFLEYVFTMPTKFANRQSRKQKRTGNT